MYVLSIKAARCVSVFVDNAQYLCIIFYERKRVLIDPLRLVTDNWLSNANIEEGQCCYYERNRRGNFLVMFTLHVGLSLRCCLPRPRISQYLSLKIRWWIDFYEVLTLLIANFSIFKIVKCSAGKFSLASPISKPPNSSILKYYLVRECRSNDFEAQKWWNVRFGHQ